MRNKIFTRIIITTLLCAFLTFSVGKVTRVSAVATTAAIAATAFIATGAIYLGYVAFTGGASYVPHDSNTAARDYLYDLGKNIAYYTSGVGIHNKIYDYLLNPAHIIDDFDFAYDRETLLDLYNDFKYITTMQDAQTFTYYESIGRPVNGYAYTFAPMYTNRWNDSPLGFTVTPYEISGYIYAQGGALPSNIDESISRNYKSGDRYTAQYTTDNGTTWRDYSSLTQSAYGYASYGGFAYFKRGTGDYADGFVLTGTNTITNLSATQYYPPLPYCPIYDSATGETLPLVGEVVEHTQLSPIYNNNNDEDGNNRPLVPYVPLPLDQTGGVPSAWGVNLGDLLDALEDLGEAAFDMSVLKGLIDAFKGNHTNDTYYQYYDDSITEYYSNTYNVIDHPIYNYDISEQDEVIPVNLNDISQYSDNRYLDQIKTSAIAGSSMLRDLAVFWHDVDPEITYIVLGCCILVLIGAFTGKLGHS